MTIEEFSQNKGKRVALVIQWIRKGLIPNASVDKNYIPNSARVPYTKARAKTSKARYISMLSATEKFYHILPELYKICQAEFDAYIQRLVDDKLIARRETDGVVYYDTLYDGTAKNNSIIKVVEAISRGATEGITTAVINTFK